MNITRNHSSYDENGDGEITAGEFRNFFPNAADEDPETGFDYDGNPFEVDKNGDEVISRPELDTFWYNFGFNYTEAEKDVQIKFLDMNKDGVITEDEFSTMMQVSCTFNLFSSSFSLAMVHN